MNRPCYASGAYTLREGSPGPGVHWSAFGFNVVQAYGRPDMALGVLCGAGHQARVEPSAHGAARSGARKQAAARARRPWWVKQGLCAGRPASPRAHAQTADDARRRARLSISCPRASSPVWIPCPNFPCEDHAPSPGAPFALPTRRDSSAGGRAAVRGRPAVFAAAPVARARGP